MLVCPKSPWRPHVVTLDKVQQNIFQNVMFNQLELSVMWCSYMVLTNPHTKPRIEFIIMKTYMYMYIYEKKSENLSKVTPVYGTVLD